MSTTIIGRLTRDPEIRFTNSGKAVCNFSLAVNRKQGDKDLVSFFDVTVWDTLAKGVHATLHKGDRAIAEGNLQQESYENKEGTKVSKVILVANNVGPDLRFATAVIHQTDNKTTAEDDEEDF
jgi:single-strand DNA-binding protein